MPQNGDVLDVVEDGELGRLVVGESEAGAIQNKWG